MTEKIKVIHVITRMDMGGSAQNTLLTALNHDPQGYSVCLIKGSTRESGMTETETQLVNNQLAAAQKRGIEVINFPSLVRRISPWNDVKAFLSLFRLFSRSKPHIVHTHTSKAGILGRLAAWLAQVPIIIHTPHGHVFYGHFNRPVARLFLYMERMLGRITNHLIALTPQEGNDYLTLNVSKADNTSVIHSGVDLSRFQKGKKEKSRKRKESGIPADALVIGFVGWLLPIKGVNFLVQAMAGVVRNHPKTLLVLVGKGEQENKLKKQVENLGLTDKVLFLGWRSDVEEIMPCFDLLVLPSLNEGMGRVLVEAMAVGLPIVASNVGGIPDLVKDGKNGLLVAPADVAGLELAISDLLRDRVRRKKMGEAGKKMCRTYSAEAMVQQINDLYAKLSKEHSYKWNSQVRFLLDTHSEKFKG